MNAPKPDQTNSVLKPVPKTVLCSARAKHEYRALSYTIWPVIFGHTCKDALQTEPKCGKLCSIGGNMVRARFLRIARCLFVSSALAIGTAEAGNTPTLTLTPAELSVRTFSAPDPTQIEVTIQAADQQINDIVLTSFSNDGIKAVMVDGEAKITGLGPHSAQAWRLKITRQQGALSSAAKLYVRVAYEVEQSAKERVHGFAYANLTISPPTVQIPLISRPSKSRAHFLRSRTSAAGRCSLL